MQYDGSINIDTRVDTKGFNKGTRTISSSLSGLLRSVKAFGVALTTAFGFAAIFRFIGGIVSSFNFMASSIGTSITELTGSLQTLKGTFVTLILTALAPIIPYLVQFVNWVSRALAMVTAFVAALFGIRVVTGQAGAGLGAAAGGQAKLAKETDKANKAMKGQLAAFDQLNVLTQPETASPADPSAGAGGGGAPLLPELAALPDISDKVQAFKDKFLAFIQPVIDAAGRLYDSLAPLGMTIWEGLQWAWENILVPIGEWTVTDLAPAFLDLLASAADALNEALIALAPYAEKFFDEFLKPLGEWVGDKIIDYLNQLTDKLDDLAIWIKENPSKFADFVEILGTLAAIVLTLAVSYKIATVVTALFGIVSGLLSGALWGVAAATLAAAWPVIALTLLIAGIIAVIYLLITRWEALSTTVKQISFIIGFYVGQMADKIKIGFFSALDAVKKAWETVFTGITSFVKTQINTIIDFINAMISNITNGINAVISGLNAVGSVVPGFSAVATVTAPQIPRLATGAVIPPNSEFLAVLGDQRSGTNIETPVALMRETVEDVVSKALVNQTINVNFNGSLGELVRVLKPVIERENKRGGVSLVRGGVS